MPTLIKKINPNLVEKSSISAKDVQVNIKKGIEVVVPDINGINHYYVWTLDDVKKIGQEGWSIRTDSKRESRESILSAYLEDDDDDVWEMNILNSMHMHLREESQVNSFLIKGYFLEFSTFHMILNTYFIFIGQENEIVYRISRLHHQLMGHISKFRI